MDEAVRLLRSDPSMSGLVADSYLGTDVFESAGRFIASAEFVGVISLLGQRVHGSTILDLGAGTGIASWAFAKSGAKTVLAVEPDPSSEVGMGALSRLVRGMPVYPMAGIAEKIPLDSASIDIIYLRQVLHHTSDLYGALGECARVLKPGGCLLATREHVVDNASQLARFRSKHALHVLTGGENAFPLSQYVSAIEQAGLSLSQIMGPWDSVINAFPAVRSSRELNSYPCDLLRRRLGRVGEVLATLPMIHYMVWKRLNRSVPGRMYSFLAAKPEGVRA